MAATVITPVQLALNTAANLPTALAVDATDGALIDFNVNDLKALVILENAATAEKTATIKAGNGIQGVKDLTITLPASGKMCIRIESMKYRFVSGDKMGKVHITGADANVKVGCVVLP